MRFQSLTVVFKHALVLIAESDSSFGWKLWDFFYRHHFLFGKLRAYLTYIYPWRVVGSIPHMSISLDILLLCLDVLWQWGVRKYSSPLQLIINSSPSPVYSRSFACKVSCPDVQRENTKKKGLVGLCSECFASRCSRSSNWI